MHDSLIFGHLAAGLLTGSRETIIIIYRYDYGHNSVCIHQKTRVQHEVIPDTNRTVRFCIWHVHFNTHRAIILGLLAGTTIEVIGADMT